MNDLIRFPTFRDTVEALTGVDPLEWNLLHEVMTVVVFVQNIAWIIFLTALPFTLIFLLIRLTRRVNRETENQRYKRH